MKIIVFGISMFVCAAWCGFNTWTSASYYGQLRTLAERQDQLDRQLAIDRKYADKFHEKFITESDEQKQLLHRALANTSAAYDLIRGTR